MKISLKIFIFTYCIIMVSTVLGGFLLIHSEYQKSIEQAKKTAIENNETIYAYVSATGSMSGTIEQIIQRLNSNETETLLGEYSKIEQHLVLGNAQNLNEEEYKYSCVERDGKTHIQVVSRYKTKYIITYQNISNLIENRNQNYQVYRNIIIISSVFIAVVIYAFAWYITRPLNKVTKMAENFKNGDYSMRVDSYYGEMKSLELEQLGSTLNQMADNLEAYISEVELAAQRKEDFVGNFTHEIKTPMTSIIGYADLLRTYNLSADKTREYSNYIYTEAKRLELLSANLLQLIVMQNEEFELKPIFVSSIFDIIEKETYFLGEKYGVELQFDYEPGCIMVEKSLIIVAIKNLIDNACKATLEKGKINIIGRKNNSQYQIIVEDFGCGIPEQEIKNILEPFYMVDKSRTRKQGGAGLGLSLTKKILDIHQGTIQIHSQLQQGTKITLSLPIVEGGALCEE